MPRRPVDAYKLRVAAHECRRINGDYFHARRVVWDARGVERAADAVGIGYSTLRRWLKNLIARAPAEVQQLAGISAADVLAAIEKSKSLEATSPARAQGDNEHLAWRGATSRKVSPSTSTARNSEQLRRRRGAHDEVSETSKSADRRRRRR